jgi:putative ABC transport system permease protein
VTAAWGALLRLARRDARRHPGRAALVTLLVALPVAGLVAAATLTLTVRPSADELARAALGAADLAAYPPPVGGADDEPGGAEPAAAEPGAAEPGSAPPTGLPAGSRIAPIWHGELPITAAGPAAGAPPVAALAVDLAGLGAGMVEVTDGRPPAPGTAQVALTEPLARRLGVGVGARVRTGFGPAEVVGVVRDPARLDREAVVAATDLPPAPSGFLVDLPPAADPAAAARAVERAGWDATTRADLSRTDPEQLLFILVLGGFGFLVTSLVTAAAFAVSAQRRRHDLALLAATGATARQLRRSVLSSALLLGAGGATLGLLLGVAASAATLPWLETWTNRAVDGLALSPVLLGAAGAAGVTVALAASWLTARSAGRTPVAAALTGRHPPRTSSARLFVAGAGAAALGVAVTVATAASAADAGTGGDLLTAGGLLLGASLTMLGLGAVSPWLVERLARRVGTRVPVAVRLAMRDTARFRSRTGPVVMAIVAGLGLSVAVGASLDTVEAGLARGYRPQLAADQLLVDGPAPAPLVDRLREELPVAADAPFTIVQPADPSTGRRLPEIVTVADARLLAALGAPPAARAAFEAGEVLVLQADGPAGSRPATAEAELIAPGGVRVVALDLVPRAVPAILLSADTLTRSGAVRAREGTRWLVRLSGPVGDDQLQRARELAGRFGQRVTVETGPPAVNSAAIQVGATIGAGALSLMIVGVGLALMSREAQRDDTLLTLVGASPRVRRGLAAARAGVLTLLGGVLAVPAGLLPIWGLSVASRGGAAADLVIPAASVAAVVVLVPAAAAGAAWAITRPRQAAGDRPAGALPR